MILLFLLIFPLEMVIPVEERLFSNKNSMEADDFSEIFSFTILLRENFLMQNLSLNYSYFK